MSMIATQRPDFSRWRSCGAEVGYPKLQRATFCCPIASSARTGKEGLKPKIKNYSFDRLEVGVDKERAKVEEFVVREARHYQEYWTAAWLRAESHWEEEQQNDRYAVNNTGKFAQQEFNAMSRRYNANLGEKCKCIVTVEKGCVVGTLDLSIQHGETFTWPGQEFLNHIFVGNKNWKGRGWMCYSYIANLCVAKSARRKGVATSMLRYAISTANAHGAQKVFVHVHRHNKPAQDLYHKFGFQVVDAANFQLYVEQTYLLCLEAPSYYEHSLPI